jgi:hypothetical protein
MKEKIVLKEEGKRLNCLGDHQLIKLTGKDTNGTHSKTLSLHLRRVATLIPFH